MKLLYKRIPFPFKTYSDYYAVKDGRVFREHKHKIDGDFCGRVSMKHVKGKTTNNQLIVDVLEKGTNLKKSFTVAKLIYGTFNGWKKTFDMVIVHKDKNTKNNAIWNLAALTKEQFERRSRTNLKSLRKVGNFANAKLSLIDVKMIRKTAKLKNRPTNKDLADAYKVSPMQITRILRGDNWKKSIK